MELLGLSPLLVALLRDLPLLLRIFLLEVVIRLEQDLDVFLRLLRLTEEALELLLLRIQLGR